LQAEQIHKRQHVEIDLTLVELGSEETGHPEIGLL
jgi:hypothetical protein